MDTSANILARSGVTGLSYPTMNNAASPSTVPGAPNQDSRINGWTAYTRNDPNNTCNFSTYTLSGANTGISNYHKGGYGYASTADLIPNCPQLNPLSSLQPRNFPFYPGDMYQANPASIHGGTLFTDIPTLQRYEPDGTSSYIPATDSSQTGSGKSLCYLSTKMSPKVISKQTGGSFK